MDSESILVSPLSGLTPLWSLVLLHLLKRSPLSRNTPLQQFALVLLERSSDALGGPGGAHQPVAALQREDYAGGPGGGVGRAGGGI